MIDTGVVEALLDSVGGDREFLGELIDTWLDDAPRQLALIETAVAARDADRLLPPAHTLKSTSASLGAMEVADLARAMEQGARSGVLADTEAVARLRVSIEGASEGLRSIAAHGREDGSA